MSRESDKWTADNPIFVFGSNLEGAHGGGAAGYARKFRGAIWGQAYGPQGTCFALPTCKWTTDKPGFEMELGDVAVHVYRFRDYAALKPEMNFQITQVGCGLAGWKPEQIAPLFADCGDNVYFDFAWEPFLPPGKKYWGTT